MGRLAIVVEDDPGDRTQIAEILSKSGFVVLAASNSGQALDCLAGCQYPDLVVLDWFCDGQDAGDGPAQGIVKTMLKGSFAALAIVTHDAIRARDNMPEEFPEEFYVCHAKEDMDQVMQEVESWSGKQQFRLSRTVGRASAMATGRVAWDLAKYTVSGVNSWLSAVDGPHDFLDMFLRLVRRQLDRTEKLLEELDQEVTMAKAAKEEVTPLLLRALSMDRYFIPAKFEVPMCGDIYRLDERRFAVLVNPACDLVKSSKRDRTAPNAALLSASTLPEFEAARRDPKEDARKRLRRIVYLLKNQDTTGSGLVRVYSLPLVPVGKPDEYSKFIDLLVHFDELSILGWDKFAEQCSAENRIARMDSPFAEALLRQYSLFANRIGLRDVPPHVLRQRAKDVMGP